MQSTSRQAFSLVELLVVIAIIGALMALLLPSIQAARESARRVQCVNNLKQIALAVQNYESQYGIVPAGTYRESSPTWLVLILPFLEQRAAAEQWDLTTQYSDPVNDVARQQRISVYLCPSRERGIEQSLEAHFSPSFPDGLVVGDHKSGGHTDYAGNAGPWWTVVPSEGDPSLGSNWTGQSAVEKGVIIEQMWGMHTHISATPPLVPHKSSVIWRRVTDGLSNTFLAGEKHVVQDVYGPSGVVFIAFGGGADGAFCDGFEWMTTMRLAGGRDDPSIPGKDYDNPDEQYPVAFGPGDASSNVVRNFGSWHPGLCHFAMCDASVRILSTTVDSIVLGRMAERDDGLLNQEFD